MEQSANISYRDAGVDTGAGQAFVKSIKESVQSTHTAFVLRDRAGFAGLVDVSFLKEFKQPLLVSATDGVGTKLRLARLFNRHETIGIDLVAMCTNDLLATGAKPLQFLDYIACGKLDQARMASIIAGIAEGCKQADCALIGGETAEHPDTMEPADYDLAGFVVGVVENQRRITSSNTQVGDILLAVPSSGVHSNGMSLVRRLFLRDGLYLPDDSNTCDFLLNEILLKPTIIYEKALRPLLDSNHQIHGIAHITGGGFYENIPRILSKGLAAHIKTDAYDLPDIFTRIQAKGVDSDEMFHVFNMGVGLVLAVAREKANGTLEQLKESMAQLATPALLDPFVLGEVVERKDNADIALYFN